MPKVKDPPKALTNRLTPEPESQRSLVRAELARIGERFEAADRRVKKAEVRGNAVERAAAEVERAEAAGDFWAAAMELADIFLLLLRYAIEHRSDALRLYLAEALRSELEPIVEALVRLEGRR